MEFGNQGQPRWIPTCPLCASPSAHHIEQRDSGVATDHHLCAEGHLWLAKWTEAA
jgi:hypothetical protein